MLAIDRSYQSKSPTLNRPILTQQVHPAVYAQQYDPHHVWNFEKQWRTDLFACRPVDRCCYSCFFSCCMGRKIAKHTGEKALIGCMPCSLPYLRLKLRTARRIEGTCCGDLCAGTCCTACAATQMANELESQGLWDVAKANRGKHVRIDRSALGDD